MNCFEADYFRMTGKKWSIIGWFDLLLHYELRYLLILRMNKNIVKTLLALHMSRKYGLEILSSKIGPGLYLGHAHNINVHPDAQIGRNCNLNKGCTIGRENRGVRNGAPTLGDYVWIGTNAVICGKITIGSDVLIAPNAYVNFDVPDHSIVIGSPGKIIPSVNATHRYISNSIEVLK